MSTDTIESAIQDIRDGKMIIVVDEEDRENEGDLTMAAEKVTPDAVNFMATHGRGLICLPMTAERLDAAQDPAHGRRERIDLRNGLLREHRGAAECLDGYFSRGSGAHRSLTAIDPEARPQDLIRPGHVFPLKARRGGVLERAGQTEAAVDLARIAGLHPAGVICEIMNEDGTMARLPELRKFAAKHDLKIISVVDLIKFRLGTEKLITRIEALPFESEYGDFQLLVYEDQVHRNQHLAFVKGSVNDGSRCSFGCRLKPCLPMSFKGATARRDANCESRWS